MGKCISQNNTELSQLKKTRLACHKSMVCLWETAHFFRTTLRFPQQLLACQQQHGWSIGHCIVLNNTEFSSRMISCLPQVNGWPMGNLHCSELNQCPIYSDKPWQPQHRQLCLHNTKAWTTVYNNKNMDPRAPRFSRSLRRPRSIDQRTRTILVRV